MSNALVHASVGQRRMVSRHDRIIFAQGNDHKFIPENERWTNYIEGSSMPALGNLRFGKIARFTSLYHDSSSRSFESHNLHPLLMLSRSR